MDCGCGITNLVERATATAADLAAAELAAGRPRLEAKVRRYAPRFVAVLEVGAYRSAFGRRQSCLGLQAERLGEAILCGGCCRNPSGLNAHYQLDQLAALFRELRLAAEAAG